MFEKQAATKNLIRFTSLSTASVGGYEQSKMFWHLFSMWCTFSPALLLHSLGFPFSPFSYLYSFLGNNGCIVYEMQGRSNQPNLDYSVVVLSLQDFGRVQTLLPSAVYQTICNLIDAYW